MLLNHIIIGVRHCDNLIQEAEKSFTEENTNVTSIYFDSKKTMCMGENRQMTKQNLSVILEGSKNDFLNHSVALNDNADGGFQIIRDTYSKYDIPCVRL